MGNKKNMCVGLVFLFSVNMGNKKTRPAHMFVGGNTRSSNHLSAGQSNKTLTWYHHHYKVAESSTWRN